MIAQARITSETRAAVHLAAETIELHGENLTEVRTRVKQVFINASRRAEAPLDVVIVEGDTRHHLRVEPTGRIATRPADSRPVHGPALDTAVPLAGSAATKKAVGPAAAGPDPDDGPSSEDLEATVMRPAVPAPSGAPVTAGALPAGTVPTSAQPDSMWAPAPLPVPASAPASASDAPTGRHRAVPVDDAPPAPDAPAPSGDPSTTGSSSAPAAPSAHPSPRPLPPEQAMSHQNAPESPASSALPDASQQPTGPASRQDPAARPTLQDLQAATTRPTTAPPARGWQRLVHRVTGGAISPEPSRAEMVERENLARVRKDLDSPKNIAVVNLKGGAHKTTASLMIAATLGVARGGSVLAWDNNETRGTLGWRGLPAKHQRTALDLLHDHARLQSPQASVADLDEYVRPQGETRFDILASDEDPGSAALIDGPAFEELNETLSRFYRLKVIDTGNNVRASNWLAAVRSADQLVIISTIRDDTFNAAAWMIDELRATGLAEQVDHAVTILSHSSKKKLEPELRDRLLGHFSAHTRAVTEVPFEPQFVDGAPLDWRRITPATKEAWLAATAQIVDGL